MLRRNLANLERKELFRPPNFAASNVQGSRMINAFRRFLDLQAGTIWKDLKDILPKLDGVILDVGCGAQVYRSLLAENSKYLGIDVRDAQERFGYHVPDTIYIDEDCWPIADESVNHILCTEVLEHVLEPQLFLEQIARVLTPGGHVILTVPFSARWHYIPYDYWRFTPSSFKFLLNNANFSNIKIFARGNPLTVACYKIMAIPMSLLFSSQASMVRRILDILLGTCLLPVFLLVSIIGNISLKFDWGDDCLGYTVIAIKKDGDYYDHKEQLS